MKIIEMEEKSGRVRLKVESQNDLWTLYNIIKPGDEIYAKTTREIKVGGKSIRKSMILGIKVKKMEFQPFTERLRVNGIIIYQPQKYEENGFKGSHHTINIDIGMEITIVKEKWPKYVLERMEKASKRGRYNAMIIAVDDEEAAIGIVREYGIEIIFEMALRLPGKREVEKRERIMEKKIRDLTLMIVETSNREKSKIIIISGPDYIREKITEKMRNIKYQMKWKPIIIEENVSNGGVRGIYETLRKDSVLKALREIEVIEEKRLMNMFIKYLVNNPGMTAYGAIEVEKAAKMGAIKILLILDENLHSYGEFREKMEEIMTETERKGGEIKIFSSLSEAGRKLKALGGIAAILKYNIKI